MKYLLLVSGTLLILGFQNCSQAKFSPADSDELASKLASCESGEMDCSLIAEIDEEEVEQESDEDSEKESDKDSAKNSDKECSSDDLKYICILNGPGSSVRTGLENEILMENGKTEGTVCMSKKACEEIVSLKLDVKAAAKRGFCPNKNPNVHSLTDKQVREAIAEL